MEGKEKEYTLQEIVDLVNSQQGDFIIKIELGVPDGK
jgi:hypothetical protein